MNTLITSTLTTHVQVKLLNVNGGTCNATVHPGTTSFPGVWFLEQDSSSLSVAYDGDIGSTAITSSFVHEVSAAVCNGEITKTIKLVTGVTTLLGEWRLVTASSKLSVVFTEPVAATTPVTWASVTGKPTTFPPVVADVLTAIRDKTAINALTPIADTATATATQCAVLLNAIVAALKA